MEEGPTQLPYEPSATGNKSHESPTSWLAVVVVVALIVLGVWWFASREPGEPAITIPGVSGIRGVITSVDTENSNFILERRELIEGAGELMFEEDTFTVYWNESTQFFKYDLPASVQGDITSPAEAGEIKENISVVVTPREKAGNVITGVEIRILPGSTQAEVVDDGEDSED